MNHTMPWFSLVHHHLLIYDHNGPAWTLLQPWLHLRMHLYLYIKMQNTLENPDLHYMAYDSQGMSIIDPVTYIYKKWLLRNEKQNIADDSYKKACSFRISSLRAIHPFQTTQV